MSKKTTFFIIGETTLAAQCIEFLLSRNHIIAGVYTHDNWLQEWSKMHNIPLFDTLHSLPEFDFLFSIVNPRLIPDAIIHLAKKFAVNYHDSPLPAYAGVHATSWAILNDEKSHGISWHRITNQVDAGELLKQSFFPIEKNETAISLNLKCYQHALTSFKELVIELEDDSFQLTPQNLNDRSYFGSHKKPKNVGIICFEENAEDIERLFRALTFGNHPNRLCTPKVYINGIFLFPIQIQILETDSKATPGTIITVHDAQVQIATQTKDIVLTFQDGDLQKILIKSGDCIAFRLNVEDFEKLCAELSRFESFWVNELKFKSQHPLVLTNPSSTEISEMEINLPTQFSKEEILTANLIALNRITAQNQLTVQFQSKADLPTDFEDIFLTGLPLNLTFVNEDTFHFAVSKVSQKIQILNSKSCYLKDLSLRYPQVSPSQDYAVSVQFTDDLASCSFQKKASIEIYISDKGMRLFTKGKFDFLTCYADRILLILKNKDCNIPISQIPLLSNIEMDHILSLSENKKNSRLPHFVSEIIENRAMRYPNDIAIVCDNESLSYRELIVRTQNLASFLTASNVGPEINVAVCITKSIDLIIAILAVMKSGGAFVPIEPTFPEERIKYILEDAQPLLIMTHSALKHKFEKCNKSVYLIDELPKRKGACKQLQQSNRAYIIYTSGSTGKPKGVEVEHQHLACAMKAKFEQHKLKRMHFLWTASVAFDISIANILLPLISGGTLFFSSKIENTDSDGIINLINTYKINHICPPVSLYSILLQQNKHFACPSLEYVSVGGESLTESIVHLHQKYFPQAILFNEYGPSECTILSSYAKIYDPSASLEKKSISIGKPINGVKIYILDANMQLVPAGVKGEIFIGGSGVARGYINNPELTDMKFLKTPFGRLYKTGDYGAWNEAGEIQYLGRMDQQKKFRGYRIELEEIEKTICNFIGIKQAVVSLRENDSKLVAYLVLA